MPQPRKNYSRVVGVYGRTVIHFDISEGRRRTVTLETEAAAQLYAAELEKLFAREAVTVASAAMEWLSTKSANEMSRETVRLKLASFFGEKLSAHPEELTPFWCHQRYAQLVQQYAVCTHHSRLRVAKEFLSWCVTKGLLQVSPAQAIKPEGEPKRGKPQLTLDEARTLAGVLFAELDAKGPQAEHALVILSCLYLGTRVSEVLFRTVRDLDDRGTVLRIPHGKSKNAVRRLRLPEELQRYWAEQAKAKLPTARLFSLGRTSVTNWCYRFCERAQVPGVCPHSFRGLHATLEVQEGAALSAVARRLGNTPDVAKRHYVQAGTIEQAAADRVVDLFRQ